LPAAFRNSIDAVSDRDFIIEFVFCCAVIMMHLSRLCEELILWSSTEFGFVEMDDSFSTGSSIMPQKKNPDVAELVRGKTGRVFGDLMSLLTTMKGLPLAYHSDMQEDKERLFDAADTVLACLQVCAGMIETMSVKEERMKALVSQDFSNATEVADYLARKGVPFRRAHEITGRIVRHCIERGITLSTLTLEEMRHFFDGFDADVFDTLTPESCVNRRNSPGGTSLSRVREQIEEAERLLVQVP
jgi:argininosuccinate lyase